jgi:PhnB protein
MADAATTERPDARVMRGVIPYLSLDGRAGEAADFYARAFDAKDLGRMPDPGRPGRLMHVQVEINGGALMMTDHRSEDGPGGSALSHGHLQLVVEDGKAWWDRAVGAGCQVLMPYERQPWGDDWGLLADPFGIRWAILEPGPEQAG